MKFMGSKRRLARYILPLILTERKTDQWWVEPFVGGGNIIDRFVGNRIGADQDMYVINALIAIRDHVSDLPKNKEEFSENEYKKLRENDTYIYKGYAGFAFSYGGKRLGGWRRDREERRDYVGEAYRNAVKQSLGLQGVMLINSDYQDLYIPPNSLIYCDPPYKDSTMYKNTFNHIKFWQWCRDKHSEGHTVFISEYKAPEDFKCIWEKKIVCSLTQDTGSKVALERLWRLK